MNPFLEKLSRSPLLTDGATGTVLHARGVSSAQSLESLVLTQPQWISEVHQAYASAGADVIKTHTFGANRLRLAKYELADQVHEINFQATKLVREVREIAGRALFIAGDIGPLGERIVPHGELDEAQAEEIFREQITVLWEAGADLLLFETFHSLLELQLAVRTAKSICDLPVVASMTYSENDLTPAAIEMAALAAGQLQQAGADVIGVNCLVDTEQMQEVLDAIHYAVVDTPLSAMPNAGFPSRIQGRLTYASSPELMAQTIAPFVESGVQLLGGCCGTTPSHIWAMRCALYLTEQSVDHLTVDVRTILSKNEEIDKQSALHLGVTATYGETERAPSGLLQKLQDRQFVISVEVDPPKGFNPQKQIDGAHHAKAMGADAINVTDSPMARVRMGAMSLCTLIQQQVNIETILHYTTRDRSLMALQSDLIGAHAIGLHNVLALTGDPPSLGDSQGSSAVYDVDSIGLVRIIQQLNEGVDQNDQDLGQKGNFTIAVACDPTRPDLVEEVDRFHQKVSGGAHFTMTQPIYDPQLWLDFLALYNQRHGEFPVPVLIGVLPVQSHRHATFLHEKVPGITLSEDALERMHHAGSEGRREGVRMAQELLLALKELPHVQGVYLMPSFGRYELACQVLEVLTEEERAEV